VLKSKVPKENILIKDKILNKVKDESIDLPSKGRRKPTNQIKKVPNLANQNKRRKCKAT
jgi:hypothetical protein